MDLGIDGGAGWAVRQFLQKHILNSPLGQFIVHAVQTWQQEGCLDQGASLAYFALFSLFPLILVVLSVVGFVLGPESTAYEQVLGLMEGSFPPEAVVMVESTLTDLNQSSVGAGITGFVLVLFTGSGFFSALNRAIERLWEPDDLCSKRGFFSSARETIYRKLTAFALTLGSALLILLSQASSFILKLILRLTENVDEALDFVDLNQLLVYRGVELLMTAILLVGVLMGLYRFLPPPSLRWRDVAPGALTTAILFLGLERLSNNSVIHLGSTYLSYGVIGGVMVLLLWLFLTCQIFLLGAVITYTYAHRFGSYSTLSSRVR